MHHRSRPRSPHQPCYYSTNEAAYRAMAIARNRYGDGHASERIVERVRHYFAAQATALSMAPDRGSKHDFMEPPSTRLLVRASEAASVAGASAAYRAAK